MATPDQEAIDTFMSIAGVSEAAAVKKLEEHHGNLNEAVNAHFSEGDRHSGVQEALLTEPMDIDDAMQVEARRPPSQHPLSGNLYPISAPDPNFTRSIFDGDTHITSRSPFTSHPREVSECPVQVKYGAGASGQSGSAPIIEDVSETADNHGPEIHGTVILDDGNDGITNASMTQGGINSGRVSMVQSRSGAPAIVDLPDHSSDIEEEMVRAAIEASKKDAATSSQRHDLFDLRNPTPHPVPSQLEDTELAHAVSLSLQMAERENAGREEKVGVSELNTQLLASQEEMRKIGSSNGRQSQSELGSSSILDDSEDVEDLKPLRHRRRRVSSNSAGTSTDNGGAEMNFPSSLQQNNNVQRSQHNGSSPSDEWGGITSEEHDEAVMLEAAMFGGIPEGSYATHQLMQNGLIRSLDSYPRTAHRPPSPSLTAMRLIREQQDDEFLASLQADREKELKANQEAEAAVAEDRLNEEEVRKQHQQEEEIERQIAVKEASLPKEPTPDEENAVTLLVRMPDGSRRGRRFLKTDKLQHLFNFIDVGRRVKPGSYKLVRIYPRHAFGDMELSSTLNELGLTNKQEALYLELI